MTAIAMAVHAPASRRTRRELAYAVLTLLPAIPMFVVALVGLVAGTLSLVVIGLPLLAVTLALARRGAAAFRRPARMILGWEWPVPRPGPAHGPWGRFGATLRDGAAWRALLYGFLKLPLTLITVYGAGVAIVAGTLALTSPVWWLLPAGRDLLGLDTWASTWRLVVEGALALLIMPWLVRLFVIVDGVLVRTLLAPTPDQERIAVLEESRTVITTDAAATLRRIERDLHDGTQARLVSLGIMLSRLEPRLGEPAARDLLADARRTVSEGLDELREIIRGVHPPALDDGLPTALGTLASRSAVPTELSDRSCTPPPAAVASTMYFAAAELLTNVARHARASHAHVIFDETDHTFALTVTDDGQGGALASSETGLDGLRRRVEALDGSLTIGSPAGGPTVVSLTLPKG